MGMYDELVFDCPKCGWGIYIQLKICDYPMMCQWRIGDRVDKDEIYPEYHRHIISPEYDRCPNCKSAFIFDCTDGTIKIEIWDEKEVLNDPTTDYFKQMRFWLRVHEKPREAMIILQLSRMLGDPTIFDYFF